MAVSGVVKSRTTGQRKRKRAVYHSHRADDLVLVLGGPHLLDGHKIGNLANPINTEKAGEQDVGFGKIELLTFDSIHFGRRDTEKATFCYIEQGAEDTGRIEPWQTAPID